MNLVWILQQLKTFFPIIFSILAINFLSWIQLKKHFSLWRCTISSLAGIIIGTWITRQINPAAAQTILEHSFNLKLAWMLKKLVTGLIAITGAGAIVFIHECGHFLFCKLFGIKTPTFSIGMGSPLFSFKVADTNFQVSPLPLGGYVEIEYNEENRSAPGNFHSLAYFKKLLILLGGVTFNLFGALAIYTGINYFKGMPDKVQSVLVTSIEPSSVAKDLLAPGDIILGANLVPFTEGTTTLEGYLDQIVASKGKTLTLLVQKQFQDTNDASWVDIKVPASEKTHGILGIRLQPNMSKKFATPLSFLASFKKASFMIWQQIQLIAISLYDLLKSKSLEGVAGPIMTIARGFQIADQDLISFLLFLGFISINLALFNVMPLSIFDGGRVLTTTLEAIIGRPLATFTNLLHIFSAVIIGAVALLVSYREIKMLILAYLGGSGFG